MGARSGLASSLERGSGLHGPHSFTSDSSVSLQLLLLELNLDSNQSRVSPATQADQSAALQVVMYHDSVSKNVWRSADEGKGWEIIKGVPHGEALMLIDHPYDTKIVR